MTTHVILHTKGKESCESLKLLLEYIKYEEFGWLICADFKVREF
jgi:hypothetical protein